MVAQHFPGQRLAGFLMISILTTTLIACGGGSSSNDGDGNQQGSVTQYSGITTEATVTENNKEKAARASMEGSIAAANTFQVVAPFPYGVTVQGSQQLQFSEPTTALLNGMVEELVNQALNRDQVVSGAVVPSDETYEGECGGSVTEVVEPTDDGYIITLDFNDYCESETDGDYIFSGHVVVTGKDGNTSKIVYTFLTVTFPDGRSETVNNLTIEFDSEGQATSYSDFVGTNDRIYRLENMLIDNNGDEYYDISARVYDPDLGYIDFQAEGIAFCDEGISAGTITLLEAAGEYKDDVLVDFTGCNAYSVNILYPL